MGQNSSLMNDTSSSASLLLTSEPPRSLKRSLAQYQYWTSLPWLMALAAAASWQFWLGYTHNSNETTNIFLQYGRGFSYVLLLGLCVMWLPVMRHSLGALWRSRIANWLPLEYARNLHRWLGHVLLVSALIHGGGYLLYFDTLDTPFLDTLFAEEADLVHAMNTTMYEFVTEDESIEVVDLWIKDGMPADSFQELIRPIMVEDCTKCHSASSTMTYAIPTLPLSSYEQVVDLSHSGWRSRQFRINMTGLTMLTIFIVLWVSSLAIIRRRHHHIFQHLHRLGYLLAILALLHIPRYNWLAVPCFVLALEFILSHYFRIHRHCSAVVEYVSETVLTVTIKRPKGFKIELGHYLQLRIPKLKRYEWHDFSLTGVRQPSDVIVLKIKAQGDWSDALFDLVNYGRTASIEVDFRGPFASPAARALNEDCWVMVAGGIGITPFLGFLHHLILHPKQVSNFHLIWVLRDYTLLHWLEPFLTTSMLSGNFHLYVTEDEDDFALPEWLYLNNQHQVSIGNQRPDWEILLNQISNRIKKPHCFICGPDKMTDAVSRVGRRLGWQVSVEQF